MSLYKLNFTKLSKKEWDKLDKSIKMQFQKKLSERLENPRILADKLSGFDNVYKIKLKSSGFRLAYEVKDDVVIIVVIKVGKRDKFYDHLFIKE